jgi:hypothetical protein
MIGFSEVTGVRSSGLNDELSVITFAPAGVWLRATRACSICSGVAAGEATRAFTSSGCVMSTPRLIFAVPMFPPICAGRAVAPGFTCGAYNASEFPDSVPPPGWFVCTMLTFWNGVCETAFTCANCGPPVET